MEAIREVQVLLKKDSFVLEQECVTLQSICDRLEALYDQIPYLLLDIRDLEDKAEKNATSEFGNVCPTFDSVLQFIPTSEYSPPVEIFRAFIDSLRDSPKFLASALRDYVSNSQDMDRGSGSYRGSGSVRPFESRSSISNMEHDATARTLLNVLYNQSWSWTDEKCLLHLLDAMIDLEVQKCVAERKQTSTGLFDDTSSSDEDRSAASPRGAVKDILKANSLLSCLLGRYLMRSSRAFVRSVLGEEVRDLLEKDDIEVDLDPYKVLDSLSNAEEIKSMLSNPSSPKLDGSPSSPRARRHSLERSVSSPTIASRFRRKKSADNTPLQKLAMGALQKSVATKTTSPDGRVRLGVGGGDSPTASSSALEGLPFFRKDLLTEIGDVKKCIMKRTATLYSVCTKLLHSILEAVDRVPVGIRWLCQRIRASVLRNGSNLPELNANSVLTNMLLVDVVIKAMMSPDLVGLSWGLPLREKDREKLAVICNVLRHTAQGKRYDEMSPFAPMNIFVAQNAGVFDRFFEKLCNDPAASEDAPCIDSMVPKQKMSIDSPYMCSFPELRTLLSITSDCGQEKPTVVEEAFSKVCGIMFPSMNPSDHLHAANDEYGNCSNTNIFMPPENIMHDDCGFIILPPCTQMRASIESMIRCHKDVARSKDEEGRLVSKIRQVLSTLDTLIEDANSGNGQSEKGTCTDALFQYLNDQKSHYQNNHALNKAMIVDDLINGIQTYTRNNEGSFEGIVELFKKAAQDYESTEILLKELKVKKEDILFEIYTADSFAEYLVQERDHFFRLLSSRRVDTYTPRVDEIVDEFISSIQISKERVKREIAPEELIERVQNYVQNIKRELTIMFENFPRPENAVDDEDLSRLEFIPAFSFYVRYFLSRVYDHLVDPLQRKYGDADVKLQSKLSELQEFITPMQLDIPSRFWNEDVWKMAEERLNAVGSLRTPFEKMKCIISACTGLMDVMKVCSGEEAPAMDDFLPILIYVLVRANPVQLYCNTRFLAGFLTPSVIGDSQSFFAIGETEESAEEQGHASEYWFPHFEAAVMYLETVDVAVLHKEYIESVEHNGQSTHAPSKPATPSVVISSDGEAGSKTGHSKLRHHVSLTITGSEEEEAGSSLSSISTTSDASLPTASANVFTKVHEYRKAREVLHSWKKETRIEMLRRVFTSWRTYVRFAKDKGNGEASPSAEFKLPKPDRTSLLQVCNTTTRSRSPSRVHRSIDEKSGRSPELRPLSHKQSIENGTRDIPKLTRQASHPAVLPSGQKRTLARRPSREFLLDSSQERAPIQRPPRLSFSGSLSSRPAPLSATEFSNRTSRSRFENSPSNSSPTEAPFACTFADFKAEDLKIGDIPKLLSEYKALLQRAKQ